MNEFDDDEKEVQVAESNKVADFVLERFSKSKTARFTEEERWISAYRNYRGLYGPDVEFTETEKSQVFVKVTKTKVLAASGQITEVLLGNNKFPITIDRTRLPEGVEDTVHFETNPELDKLTDGPVEDPTASPKPRPTLNPGETYTDFLGRLAGLEEELEPVMDKLVSGPGVTPTAVTFHPADIAAKKMEKKIHDQLEESKASKHLRSAAFECALFGTGIMKGPFAYDKEYADWGEDGEYKPTIKTIPMISYTSIWNFYPDPEAKNMDEAEFNVERHKMSRTQLMGLKKRPHFRKKDIDEAAKFGPSYDKEWWELIMEDKTNGGSTERYEVLEFWGNIDEEIIDQYNINVPAQHKGKDSLSVNVWVCNGQVLRIVFNPFTPVNIPYYAFPYEINPYSFFGIGVAENMEDTQMLMNGFMRMAVDNAALSGNMVFEIDETNLTPGQDLSVYPGKVFKRQGGAPGQAIFGTKFPNVSNENMQMFDKARVLSDESTGFPSFAHGQTGVSGVGRTASGISMLMSAANGSIRTVVKNVDDYLLSPLGKAMFSFNMQFDFDPVIRGDLEVKASGTSSLMANEVRSQRLMSFLGVVQNPVLAPFAKMDYIIREIAISMELDPDKVTNSMQAAAVQAEILKQFQATQPQPPAPPQAGGLAGPPGANPQDPTGAGGGNIGTGQAPAPGEQGFSGNAGTPPAGPPGEGPPQ